MTKHDQNVALGLFLGGCTISFGAGMIFTPAGIILFGLLTVAMTVLLGVQVKR